jgi:pimeloyl-ACP methyl ester carboxylesterase
MATIAMAHGLFSDTSFDVAQADALRARGHQVIAVDLPGHGRSAGKPTDPAAYTFAALADAMAAAVGAAGPVVAMGGSLGAAAALAFARRHPARCQALVLLQPAFLYGPRPELAAAARAARGRLPQFWAEVTGDPRSAEQAAAQDEAAVLAAAQGLAADALLDGPADLAGIGQPTLLVGRPGDRAHPIEVAEAYWRHIPTSRLIVETPGDVALWDRPADLAAAVDRFLAEVGVYH